MITILYVLSAAVPTPADMHAHIDTMSYFDEQTARIRIAANGTLDLTDEPRKTLRSTFVKTLILESHDKPVIDIRGATVDGTLDFSNTIIDSGLRLLECTFTGAVDLRRTTFSRTVQLDGSTFVAGFYADNSKFAQDISLLRVTSQHDFMLTNCDVHLDVRADELKLTPPVQDDKPHRADFSFLRVRGSVYLRGAEVRMPMTLAYAQITGLLVMSRIQMHAELDAHSFTAGQLFLDDGSFFSGVDFRYVTIVGRIHGNKATFTASQEHEIRFDNMSAGGWVHFTESVFFGHVHFPSATIGSDFVCSDCVFNGDANLDSIVVGRGLYLERAKFFANAELSHARVGDPRSGVIEAPGVTFSEMHLTGSIVRGSVNFRSSIVVSRNGGTAVYLDNADCRGLILDSMKGELQLLNLERANISGNLLLAESRIGRAELAGMTAIESTFDRVAFLDFCDLRSAELGVWHMRFPGWPQASNALLLDGVNFRHVDEGIRPLDYVTVRELLMTAAYSVDAHQRFEEFFRSSGDFDKAEATYIMRKDREYGMLVWPDRQWHWVTWAVVGYGKKPELALLWAVGVVLFGSLIVSPRKMSYIGKGNEADARFFRWWYACDCFLPFVNLGFAECWTPRTRLLAFFLPFLVVTGWILIPLGLAALSGFIK